jgi:beta-glucosidase
VEGDLAVVRQEIDFLGLNYYCRSFCRSDDRHPLKVARAGAPAGRPRTCLDWEIHPDGLKQMLLRLRDEYGNPEVYVTENGAAFEEPETVGGNGLADDGRIAFLQGYLGALREAIAEGADVKGYMIWSIIDNFEWAWGYRPRFGLVHVDYRTQTRTPKKSFGWYADVAGRNALPE